MSIALFRCYTVSQYIVYCDTSDSWRYAAPLYEHVTSTDAAMMHCCCDRFSKAEPRYRMCLVWSGLNRKSIHQGWQHGTQIYSHVCRVKKTGCRASAPQWHGAVNGPGLDGHLRPRLKYGRSNDRPIDEGVHQSWQLLLESGLGIWPLDPGAQKITVSS